LHDRWGAEGSETLGNNVQTVGKKAKGRKNMFTKMVIQKWE